MYDWANSREFWGLPISEQNRLFNTPCGSGWNCPDCGELYQYHCGAPTTGLYAFFYGPDANRLWDGSGCCSKEYNRQCFGWGGVS